MKANKKVNPARTQLIESSQASKAQRERMVKEADSVTKAMSIAALSINDMLILNYKTVSNCEIFKTFHDWKKEGFKVKKNEKSYRVWGKPIKARKTTDEKDGEKDEFRMFPMCCLFNESQVEKLDSNPEESEIAVVQTTEDSSPVIVPKTIEQAEPELLDNPFVSANYNEQQDARKDRLHERADKKRTEADSQYKRSHALVEAISFGQPILVGHHSERAHRNALDKSWNALGKSVKLGEYADHLDSKANKGMSPVPLTKIKYS